jgi:hypothetical protein
MLSLQPWQPVGVPARAATDMGDAKNQKKAEKKIRGLSSVAA